MRAARHAAEFFVRHWGETALRSDFRLRLMLQGPCRNSAAGPPSLHANLSPMLTALPSGLQPAKSHVEIPQSGANAPENAAERPIEHLCQVCPTCSARLDSYRCKLVCNQCGYFMSCADYY